LAFGALVTLAASWVGTLSMVGVAVGSSVADGVAVWVAATVVASSVLGDAGGWTSSPMLPVLLELPKVTVGVDPPPTVVVACVVVACVVVVVVVLGLVLSVVSSAVVAWVST
jgi:hypothetical protein